MKSLQRLFLCLSLALLAGCESAPPTHLASVFIEAPESASLSMRRKVTLPVSGITVTVLPKELSLAEDLLNTEVVETGEPDLRVTSLLVQLNRQAARTIMDVTRQARGKHLILVVNETAVGLMPIDEQVVDGNLFFNVEIKGKSNRAAAEELSRQLNASILIIRKAKESQ